MFIHHNTRQYNNSNRPDRSSGKKTRDVLTAGGQGEQDIDGIFVPRLLDGFAGAADFDKNKYVTSWELSLFMAQKIPQDAYTRGWKQNPQFGKLTNEEGEFIFKIVDHTY